VTRTSSRVVDRRRQPPEAHLLHFYFTQSQKQATRMGQPWQEASKGAKYQIWRSVLSRWWDKEEESDDDDDLSLVLFLSPVWFRGCVEAAVRRIVILVAFLVSVF
jgi:hypothetical protein